MRDVTVLLTDQTSDSRSAVVDADTLPLTLAAWLESDGYYSSHSPAVRRLADALRNGSWAAVHAAADALSVSVDVLGGAR